MSFRAKTQFTTLVVSLILVAVALGATTALLLRRVYPALTSPAPTTIETPAASTETQTETAVSDITLTASSSGQTALELLTSEHQVQAKEYDFGVFIEGIDGVMGDNQHFWAIYHNGESALVGASDLILDSGDQVRFVYEPVAQPL